MKHVHCSRLDSISWKTCKKNKFKLKVRETVDVSWLPLKGSYNKVKDQHGRIILPDGGEALINLPNTPNIFNDSELTIYYN